MIFEILIEIIIFITSLLNYHNSFSPDFATPLIIMSYKMITKISKIFLSILQDAIGKRKRFAKCSRRETRREKENPSNELKKNFKRNL